MTQLTKLWEKKGFIIDMDGVIYHGNRLLEGVADFIRFLQDENKAYLFLTNSSERSARELQQKLARMGLNVGEEHFYTSALATAMFLRSQARTKNGVYVIGESGLINALYEAGFTMNDVDPEYVVVGETRSYTYERIEKAVYLVQRGARLIGTNPDLTAPAEQGIVPATRALIAPIELTCGKEAYFIGKPNPIMMRMGLNKLGTQAEETVIVGDRMDTDIIAGIQSAIDTVLVLSGVTKKEEIASFPYRPTYVLNGVGEIPPSLPIK